jgi:hypothetical protein
MSKKRIKQYLMLLTVIGLVSIASGSGTFASFSAETTNAGNTLSTGSITLDNVVNAGSDCYSSGGAGNVNAACDVIWTVPTWAPGDPVNTQELTLSNTGSLDPTDLTFWAPKVDTAGALSGGGLVCNFESYTPAGASNVYAGTGNPCTGVTFHMQEYTDGTFGTPTSTCAFPVDAINPCGANYAALSTLPDSGTPGTIAGGLAHGTSRYFKLTVKYPASAGNADNEYQAQKTHFDLTWHVQ